MKEKMVEALADLVYACHKLNHKGNIRVYAISQTIERLQHSNASLVRFGDGEIILMSGKSNITQNGSRELAERLKDVIRFREEDFLIALPDIFQKMDDYQQRSQNFWKKHLLRYRRYYNKYCENCRIYDNAFLSRCYYLMQNHEECSKWFAGIRTIWNGRKITIVEGERSHSGVGNDLFTNTADIERIICPASNAYSYYDIILNNCRQRSKERIFLLALGAAAKPLALDLFREGYRVIDIGNLDLEYEWYLQKATDKVPLKKHSLTGVQANIEAGYMDYAEQIITAIYTEGIY